MPTNPNLAKLPADALTAELARREEEAQRQQAEADAAWKAEQANRARPILAGWRARDEELIASERQAYDDFRAAVLEDPLIAAYVRYRFYPYRRRNLRTEAENAAHVLRDEQAAQRIPTMTEWGSRLVEDVTAIADEEAQRLAGEESQAVLHQLQRPEGT